MASQGFWEKSRTHQFLAAVLRFFVPSSLRATNAPVDGYVPSKATGEDLFTWIAPGGGGGGQASIQFKDDGSNLGASGTVDTLDVVGAGATATRVGNVVTLTVPGASASVESPGCVFSNGNLTLTGTLTSEIQIPYGGTIEAWTIVGDAAGDASIIVSHATYAAYSTMTTLFTATCTGSNKAQATGLSHAVTAGDILRFSGSGFALFTRVSITLEVN